MARETVLKRLFDLTLALIGLVITGPFLLAAALWVKLDSPGPAFYRGERVGQGGARFRMYKLRTMVSQADRQGPAVTQGRDPRVTRAGRTLRKWKIDELPQLINVVKGDMSLVGPRPESPRYVAFYTPEQRQVLRVKPGVTGLTQIRYRHEEVLLQGCADLEAEYVQNIMPQKLQLDLEYIRRRSLLLDLELIVQTVACVFARPDGHVSTAVSEESRYAARSSSR